MDAGPKDSPGEVVGVEGRFLLSGPKPPDVSEVFPQRLLVAVQPQLIRESHYVIQQGLRLVARILKTQVLLQR